MKLIKTVQSAEGKINTLSRLLGIIAIGILVAMMLFTVVNVVLRAFFNRPIRPRGRGRIQGDVLKLFKFLKNPSLYMSIHGI